MHEDHPNRRPTRLSRFDYSEKRTYFVTICTFGRREMLAEICRGGALLRPAGKIVEAQILGLPDRYNIQVDKFVIMPNHIHLLLGGAREEQSSSPTVISVIQALKSITTKQINAQENCPGRQIWQRSFHDHIIRNEIDYMEIWQYIDENPLKWELDRFYVTSDLA